MLNTEEMKNQIDLLKKELEKVGIKDGLFYKTKQTKLNLRNNEVTVDGALFSFGRLGYSPYPHIECLLTSRNNEVCSLVFVGEDKVGFALKKDVYLEQPITKDEDMFFDINSLKDLIEKLEVKEIYKEIYLEEKERLLHELSVLEKIITDFNLK